MSKIDPHLFSAHEHALEREPQPCPECGANLMVRHGKHGPFLGCSTYPACNYIRPLTSQGVELHKVLEGSACPICGQLLAIKKGRYGLFIGCTQYPLCQHIESQGELESSEVPCPACGRGHLISRTSRYGKMFYACDSFPRCKYVVNDKPVAQSCPKCGWQILVERQVRHGSKLCCPQKLCDYQTDI
jgi:putative DNA topoisomerase